MTHHVTYFRFRALAPAICAAGVIAASPALAAPITATFDFRSDETNVVTVSQSGGSGTITDPASSQTINFNSGYDDGAGNDVAAPLLIEPTTGASRGAGVDAGIPGNQPDQLDSILSGGAIEEFIEFAFPQETTLVGVEFQGLAATEQYELIIDGGTPIVVTGTSNYAFATATTVNAGGTLRITALDEVNDPGNESTFRIESLSVQVVPEPGSMILTAAGLGLIALRRR
jgi:hypothetical protein